MKVHILQNPRTQKSSHSKTSNERPVVFTTCANIGSHITFPNLSISIDKMGVKTSKSLHVRPETGSLVAFHL